MFASGYNLDRRSFFNNLVSLLVYAFVGTLINNLVFAGLCYAFNFAYLTPFSFAEALVFGSILSATDPVTVLAIFRELRVDPDLYANVFGESVLNDAVAIVLFRTFSIFLTREASVESIFTAFGWFLLISVGSFLLGAVFGLWSALFFKYTHFYRHVVLEGCLVCIFAYMSFLLADGLGLSGIISVLFCGLTMGQYMVGNLSEKTRLYTKEMFEVLSTLTETIIFAYLGFSLFSFAQTWDVALIFVTLFNLLISRFAQVLPLTLLINLSRWWALRRGTGKHETIPWTHDVMLWFAGLRGALAFALSLDVPSSNGGVILSTTLIICVATIFLLGSFAGFMLKLLGIRTGVPSNVIIETKYAKAAKVNQKYLVPFFSRTAESREQVAESDNVDVHDPALHDEWLNSQDTQEDIQLQFSTSRISVVKLPIRTH